MSQPVGRDLRKASTVLSHRNCGGWGVEAERLERGGPCWLLKPQSTQSGNGHFLAYIPSWWKNLPRLVRVGDAPFTITTITYKVVVYAPVKRADTLPLFLLYPYMYSVAETEANGDSRSKYGRYPSLVGPLGSSCRYKRFLSCLGCSSLPSVIFFFNFICPHRPASWAVSRAASPVFQYVSLSRSVRSLKR
jgi:hypothetical protein